MNHRLIEYTTHAASADANEALIVDVFSALRKDPPPGFRYLVLRTATGRFVHLSMADADESPLPALPAFRRFREGLPSRVTIAPATTDVTVVGAYGWVDPARTR